MLGGHKCQEQLVAIAEVVVHGRLGHPGTTSGRRHRNRLRATEGDQVSRGIKDSCSRPLHGIACPDVG
jgi:hypothetical protein